MIDILDRMGEDYTLTPRVILVVGKIAKGFRKATADLLCRDREAEGLRRAADRKARKWRKVVGETGMFLDSETALGFVKETEKKEQAKMTARSRSDSRTKALIMGKKCGGYDEERKRVGKGFIIFHNMYVVDGKVQRTSTVPTEVIQEGDSEVE